MTCDGGDGAVDCRFAEPAEADLSAAYPAGRSGEEDLVSRFALLDALANLAHGDVVEDRHERSDRAIGGRGVFGVNPDPADKAGLDAHKFAVAKDVDLEAPQGGW